MFGLHEIGIIISTYCVCFYRNNEEKITFPNEYISTSEMRFTTYYVMDESANRLMYGLYVLHAHAPIYMQHMYNTLDGVCVYALAPKMRLTTSKLVRMLRYKGESSLLQDLDVTIQRGQSLLKLNESAASSPS